MQYGRCWLQNLYVEKIYGSNITEEADKGYVLKSLIT